MRFNVLASGSSGNCTLIEAGSTVLLVDCGLPLAELARRLSIAGVALDLISSVLVSHEHTDHIKGLPALCKHLKIPVHISRRALEAVQSLRSLSLGEDLKSGSPIEIGRLKVTPIAVPHDSADPMAFKFEHEGSVLAIVTDLGHIPKSVSSHLTGCDALVIESNHDTDKLRNGRYPWTVKTRILSPIGHLSNEATARFLKDNFDGKARHIILAHLSKENNHPALASIKAEEALAARNRIFDYDLRVALPDSPLGWIEL
ncbi:MAG: MBL fold metallo-hydrolase [Acidobacteriota bacterium]|nr:MBL fold metallo-hydrolase [Blastocatellia bacterium]MDW8411983.1 MBL fold metallo-hydrolase [Acidobacteriota bacterium]